MEYVTHQNWGGLWEIFYGEQYFSIKLIEEPDNWKFLERIGWEKEMSLDNETHLHYFIPC